MKNKLLLLTAFILCIPVFAFALEDDEVNLEDIQYVLTENGVSESQIVELPTVASETNGKPYFSASGGVTIAGWAGNWTSGESYYDLSEYKEVELQMTNESGTNEELGIRFIVANESGDAYQQIVVYVDFSTGTTQKVILNFEDEGAESRKLCSVKINGWDGRDYELKLDHAIARKEGGIVEPKPDPTWHTLFDFESDAIGAQYNTGENADALVVEDPADASNKALSVTTFNWYSYFPIFDVTLPDGKTLGDYDGISYRIYIKSQEEGSTPNYTQTRININDEQIYYDGINEDGNATYPLQGNLDAWTTKTYYFSQLIVGEDGVGVSTYELTDAQKALTSFSLSFGLATNGADYYIDDIKLRENYTSGIKNTSIEKLNTLYVSNNTLYLGNTVSEVLVYDISGSLRVSAQNVSNVNMSTLNPGIYLTKVKVDGKTYVNKIVK